MIEIRNVSKRFKSNVVLDNISLTIKDATTFGLVGINGAGKSTLLRIMAGVYEADEGEIIIDGQNIFDNETKKKEILFLPDDLYFSPSINATKIMEIYDTFYDFDKGIFDWYLNTYRLNPNLSLRSYSKGMRRQLFICLAFAASPKYLFLDEAFDGLDPAARMIFKQGLSMHMQKTGGTAVVSSHSLRELGDICDSYGIIDGKKIRGYANLNEPCGNVYKFQLAFSEVPNRHDFDFEILSFEGSGRIIRIVARGDKQELLTKIYARMPLVVEELPLDFEQFFFSEVRRDNQL